MLSLEYRKKLQQWRQWWERRGGAVAYMTENEEFAFFRSSEILGEKN